MGGLNVGLAATWATLVVALLVSASALLWGQGRSAFERPTRVLYALQVAGLAFMALWLARLFLTHDFRYAYVANYSSRAMERRYVFASFWGGQEGTFLLWATWSTLVAAFLFRLRTRIAPTAIFFANWAPIFLLFILTVSSPFRMLAQVPADGNGLNPLLQDPWMTIHPPTLFLGYSSLIAPFALAMATLVHRDEKAWLASVPPFVLLSTVILGTGFTMGGLWAYKVLGWGGFWGWDPVENASLVPWLFNVALLHALLVQRATGALGRTTLFLGITSYLFVLYGSFLTRSGVLADFSVHSFVDLGLSGYLLAFLFAFLIAGYGAWALRAGAFRRNDVHLAPWSREFALWLGMLAFAIMGVLTMAGTSAPLLSKLFTGAAGNVQTDYYNHVNGPLGLLVCVLVAIGPLMRWRQDAPGALWRTALPYIAVGLAAGVGAYALGMRSPVNLALVAGAVFTFLANVNVTLKAARRGATYAAGYVSHLGFSLLILGVLSYSTFGKQQQVSLPLGVPTKVLDFKMTYQGKREATDHRDRMAIAVEGEGKKFEAMPILYFSQFNQGVMRNPHVERYWSHDVYISPIELKTGADAAGATAGATLGKGQSGTSGGVPVTFQDFEREGVMGDPNGFTIKARVLVGTGSSAVVVRPAVKVGGPYGMQKIAADLPGGGSVTLGKLDPNSETAEIIVTPSGGAAAAASTETLAVEVSTKPFIGLVWVGMATLLFGAGLGIARRLALQSQPRAIPAVATARAAVIGVVIALVAVVLALVLGVRRADAAMSFAQFTNQNLGGDSAPAWSSDGGFVYYSTRATGFPYIFRKATNAPLTDLGTRLTSWLNDEYSVTLCKDGLYAMIETADSLGARHLYRCPATGGAPLTKVTYGPHLDMQPSWWGSGATQEVAFSTDRGGAGYQIWTIVPNGTLPASVYTPVTGPGFNDFHPSFSPDGQKIVFSSDRAGGNQLFVCTRTAGGWSAPAVLTTGAGAKLDPAWSPNGLHIAYSVVSTGHTVSTQTWIINADGSGAQLVTAAGSYDAQPSWAPSDNQLAFVSDQSGAKYIWLATGLSTPAATSTWGRLKGLYRE